MGPSELQQLHVESNSDCSEHLYNSCPGCIYIYGMNNYANLIPSGSPMHLIKLVCSNINT